MRFSRMITAVDAHAAGMHGRVVILDTIFTARIVGEARVGAHAAIVPTIRGRAWISAFAQYVLAPDDPFPEGFMVGDVWPM